MEIEFMDAQEMHQAFPETFKVPSESQFEKMAKGDLVKICAGGERMWVRVETVDGNKVTGKIYSDLILTERHHLKAQDPIEFERKHIYIIE